MEEASLEDETVVGTGERTGGPDQGQEFTSSPEAATFMSSIEPAELQRCVFSDSLVAVSEGGRNLGNFDLVVEFARRAERPCVRVRAQSHGAIDDCPCGTTVTAYLTTDLEVLEEDCHEYVKLKGSSVDKRCHMVQRDGQMMINEVTRMGEEVTKKSISYPVSALRGLVTEGSSLLLMRLIALRKKMPENTMFVSLDQEFRIVHTTFSELGFKELEAQGGILKVFGVERIVHSVKESPLTWQSYFLDDGHLASREQVGSPVTMRLLHLPSKTEKAALVLEEDMEMQSKFLDRKEEIKADHAQYLQQHPEIRALISDFLQSLLLRKPDDVVQFAGEYFLPFASHRPPDPNTKAQSI
ncbi:ciliogenesis-associated TTC17-interacting protein [Salarias fasciatus]|uniref:Ciliogenesis-associated TTC17-interacting protein n=1 Tax=Salarias fasciatus TaxID=181472 RepID=A0A672FH83_SALFA|nr:ciliogenesis-associated TTC17-interacting protein [Salarias fasciatus]